MDWHGRNTSSFASDIHRLTFDPKINTVIQCYQYTVRSEAVRRVSTLIVPQNSDQVKHEVQKLPDHTLRLWLRKVSRAPSKQTVPDESPDSTYFVDWNPGSGYAYCVSFHCLAHSAHLIVSGSRIGQVMHRFTPMIQAQKLSVTYRFFVKPFLNLWTTSTYPVRSYAQCSGVICTSPLLP